MHRLNKLEIHYVNLRPISDDTWDTYDILIQPTPGSRVAFSEDGRRAHIHFTISCSESYFPHEYPPEDVPLQKLKDKGIWQNFTKNGVYTRVSIDQSDHDESEESVYYDRKVTLDDSGPWEIQLKGLNIDFEKMTLSFGWKDVLDCLYARQWQQRWCWNFTRFRVKNHGRKCTFKECSYLPWKDRIAGTKMRDGEL
jgi:hypothetical protein